MTPTQLSLRHLRAQGWLVDVCERWVPGQTGQVRKDLFGMLDLIAVRTTETLGIQVTSAGNVASRMLKMTDEDHLPKLLALKGAGWLVVVHGWRKSTRDGHACKHGKQACACIWTLHRNEQL